MLREQKQPVSPRTELKDSFTLITHIQHSSGNILSVKIVHLQVNCFYNGPHIKTTDVLAFWIRFYNNVNMSITEATQ